MLGNVKSILLHDFDTEHTFGQVTNLMATILSLF